MPENEIIKKAINTLKQGGIIGFPADTVYGIGCDAYNQSAVKKIYKLKQRPPHKPLILFIKAKSELKKYATQVPLTGMKLIESFWPGGLTIIFKAKHDSPIQGPNSTVGIRIPNNELLLEILHRYGRPLATTSANLEGTNPPTSHSELNIEPDFIIPGECKLKAPSTIIDLSSFPPTLLRKGSLGIESLGIFELESVIRRHIKLGPGLKFCVLFVCLGNRCRSPMAKGIFKKLSPSVEVDACGVRGVYGESPTEPAIQVMQEIGIDISSYYSKPISSNLINWADLILTMEESQRIEIIKLFPFAKFKTHLIKPDGIKDPVGGTREIYIETREQLKRSIISWMKELEKSSHRFQYHRLD